MGTRGFEPASSRIKGVSTIEVPIRTAHQALTRGCIAREKADEGDIRRVAVTPHPTRKAGWQESNLRYLLRMEAALIDRTGRSHTLKLCSREIIALTCNFSKIEVTPRASAPEVPSAYSRPRAGTNPFTAVSITDLERLSGLLRFRPLECRGPGLELLLPLRQLRFRWCCARSAPWPRIQSASVGCPLRLRPSRTGFWSERPGDTDHVALGLRHRPRAGCRREDHDLSGIGPADAVMVASGPAEVFPARRLGTVEEFLHVLAASHPHQPSIRR